VRCWKSRCPRCLVEAEVHAASPKRPRVRRRGRVFALGFGILFGLSAGLSSDRAVAEALGETYVGVRELWAEGSAAFQAGNYELAADRFDRVYQIDRAPTTGLWVARSLERAGKLLEALDRYREVSDQPWSGDITQSVWEAKRAAQREAAALTPLIPGVRVELRGAAAEQVNIRLNERALPAGLVGVRRWVNPGTVRVEGESGGQRVEQLVVVARGETKTVVLDFTRKVSNVDRATLRAPPRPSTDFRGVRRTAGYVSIGVGGAALLTGAMFGYLALRDGDELDRDCPGRVCSSSLASRVDTYESEKRISTIGIVSGLALGAAGLALYLSVPNERKPTPALRVGVTARGLAVEGAF